MILHKDLVVLAFGRQRFRLVHCADMDIEGSNPIGVQQKLHDFISVIVQECMKSLHSFCSLSLNSNPATSTSSDTELHNILFPSELLIPLQQLRLAGKGESMLNWRGGRTLLSIAEIKAKYGPWLQLYSLRDSYDVFISYR